MYERSWSSGLQSGKELLEFSTQELISSASREAYFSVVPERDEKNIKGCTRSVVWLNPAGCFDTFLGSLVPVTFLGPFFGFTFDTATIVISSVWSSACTIGSGGIVTAFNQEVSMLLLFVAGEPGTGDADSFSLLCLMYIVKRTKANRDTVDKRMGILCVCHMARSSIWLLEQ